MVVTRSQAGMSNNNTSGPSTAALSIRKFDGKNFVVWKSQVEAYLMVKDCFDAVKYPPPVAAGATPGTSSKKSDDSVRAKSSRLGREEQLCQGRVTAVIGR